MKTVRLGVIGLGNMGTVHARSIVEGKIRGAVLSAVADGSVERHADYPDLPGFEAGEEMIDSGLIDGVIIATPHFSHTTLGIAALKAGLHVMVEKPLSVHKADAEKLIQAHGRRRSVFATMLNQRTDPRYRKIKDLVDSGELGRIWRIIWIVTDWFRTEAYYASSPWRATWKGEGGGVLMNQCPHQLDLLQWMFGMPTSVQARCHLGKYHRIEVEDEVTAYLEFKGGATGVFITSTGEAPGTNRLEVAGEMGRLVYEEGKLRFIRNRQPSQQFLRTSDSHFGRPEAWDVELPLPPDQGGQHLEVLQNFVDCIRDRRKKLLSPGREGLHAVELANAMLYSSMQDRRVELPLDAEAYEQMLKKLQAQSKPPRKRKSGPKARASANDFQSSF